MYCSKPVIFHKFLPFTSTTSSSHTLPVPSWKQHKDHYMCTNSGLNLHRTYARRVRSIIHPWKFPTWLNKVLSNLNLTCSEQHIGPETSRGPFQPELLYNPGGGKEHHTVRRRLGHSQGNDLCQERDMSKRKAPIFHWNKAPPSSCFPSQLPPAPLYRHSISSTKVGPFSVLRAATWNLTKCRFWSKISSTVLTTRLQWP